MQDELLIAKTEKKIYEILPHEPESMLTTLFIIGMAAYYLWRMFAITPSHEELVSYCLFINNGPIYSALNWPSPNNHVGYSVLASLLNYFGNSYIGLRGISYICAVGNLILVNRICKRFFTHGMALGGMVLYGSMQVVNEYSVQGRGYTLATFCFLLSVYLSCEICKSGENARFLSIIYIVCIVFGMYTTPSSIYWVVPVCLTVLLYLFINGFRSRRYFASDLENVYLRKLNSFIGSTAIAVFITFVLYSALWLSLGAKALIEDEASLFYGSNDMTIFLRNPMAALSSGMQYMNTKRHLVEEDVDLFKEKFLSWIVDLLNYMLPGLWFLLAIFIISGVSIMLVECFRHFEYSRTVINLMVVTNIAYVVIVLLSTHKLPALRGFGYGSFLMTICVCCTLEKCINVGIRLYNKYVGKNDTSSKKENETLISSGKWYEIQGVYIPVIVIIFLFFARFADTNFNAQIGSRENDIFNTMYIADIAGKKNPCVLDEDQDYLMQFGFGINCEKTDVTGADVVILDRHMKDPQYTGEYLDRFYQTYDTIDWDYLDTMHIQYENDSIILYTK